MDDEFGGGDIGGFDDSSSMDMGGTFDDSGSIDIGGGVDDGDLGLGGDIGSGELEISEDIGGGLFDSEGITDSSSLEIEEDVPVSDSLTPEENAPEIEVIPEDIDTNPAITEPGAELSHEEFIDAQEEFEQSVIDGTVHNDDIEPGAELSHGEFLGAQEEFEQSIADGSVHDDDIEPGAEMTHREFFEAQEVLDGEREPGAEMSHEEFLQVQDDFEAEIRGDVDWPDNDGAVEGTEHEIELGVGDEITRREHSGHPNLDGSFAGTGDIGFEESSLPGEEGDYDTHHLEVVEELPDDYTVTVGEVAPAFGHEGGGEQIHVTRENWLNPDAEPLDVPLQDLKDYGYLSEDETPEVEQVNDFEEGDD
jgi:hypothetical protein